MKRIASFGVAALCFLVLHAIVSSDILRPLDESIQNQRFALADRQASGDHVLIEIDPQSLSAYGIWPWPRRFHAQMIDKLLDLNVGEIAFDIDFSSKSNDVDDALLAAALERAGGFVMLATFRQQAVDREGNLVTVENSPNDLFAQHAWPAAVNVIADMDGMVRAFPYAMQIGGQRVPSMPSVLTGVDGEAGAQFLIDFSINPDTVPRYSYIDVIEGFVDPEELDGRNIVIGAGAVELRDNFAVPRHGIVSGPMLQILAAETLAQGRVLTDPGASPMLVLLAVLGVLAALRFEGTGPVRILVGSFVISGLTEVGSYIALTEWRLLIDTAIIHVGLIIMTSAFLALEMERKRKAAQVAGARQLATKAVLDRVIADHFDAVVVVSSQGQVLALSEPARELFGVQEGETPAAAEFLPASFMTPVQQALAAASDEEAPKAELQALRHVTGDGHELMLEYTVTLSRVGTDRNGRPEHVACLTIRDVTARHEHEKHITFLANHDSLTGALSRTRLVQKISDYIGGWAEGEADLTVILVDLDRFKNVNETLGHSAGDELLREVTRRLENCETYCVARLGADRFAMALPGLLDEEGTQRFAGQLIAALTDPYHLGEQRALIGVSIGITDTARSGTDPETLIAHADMALGEAKDMPGNAFFEFARDLDEKVNRNQALEAALREALTAREISVAYQPQVDLATGKVVGAEALVRWTNETLGRIGPDQFIPVAEDTGLIVDIGRFVLLQACWDATLWPSNTRVAVNVSPFQFEYGDIVGDVRRALTGSGLDPHRLDIEITERLFISKTSAFVEKLEAIRRLGVGVALDDFGTGYSSLGYLGQLPIDKIKVDQSFVRGLPHDSTAMAIIRSVLTLSDAMGKSVIAEGIENAEQAYVLRLAGCAQGQGFHFGRPQSNETFIDLVDETRGSRRLPAIA